MVSPWFLSWFLHGFSTVSIRFPFCSVFVVINPVPLAKSFVEVAQRLQATTTKFEDPKESKEDVSSDENGPQIPELHRQESSIGLAAVSMIQSAIGKSDIKSGMIDLLICNS